MNSLSIDYFFNRIYDVLLGIKYFWMFTILRTSPEKYISDIEGREWDGLRDRGWFNEYFAMRDAQVPVVDQHLTTWQSVLHFFGKSFPDTDGDGTPDISDPMPYDAQNLTAAELKERFEPDYTTMDSVKDFFGFAPSDADQDGVPDSYEKAHGLDVSNADTDRDGALDGSELALGTDPANNDSDSDGVLDGRDERPTDHEISAFTADTDGDGVSDLVEKKIASDPSLADSDGDGIPDGMDAYSIDPNNMTQVAQFDFDQASQGLHFAVSNPVLSLFTDMLTVCALGLVIVFVLVVLKWLFTFLESLHAYEEHFSHGHGGHSGSGLHVITHTDNQSHGQHGGASGDARSSHDFDPLGIPGLAILDGDAHQTPTHHVEAPKVEEFDVHPRFAIIKGYMSSESEALWRIGILEADTMLQEVLVEKGYRGDTVADMLKEASFKTIDLAWDAHKLRNRIAHEGSNFELTEREAMRIFALFEAVFRELKVI
jgi:hypothetical protein